MPARLREVPLPMTKSFNSYTGSNSSPQWMKTLEERYQRLHMKIIYNTGTLSQKYNPTVGRQFCDRKLVKAAINRARANSIKLAGSGRDTGRLTKSQIYNNGKNKLDITTLPTSKSSPLLYTNQRKKQFDDDGRGQREKSPCGGDVSEYNKTRCVTPSPGDHFVIAITDKKLVENTDESEPENSRQTTNVQCTDDRNIDSAIEIENVFGEDNETGDEFEKSGQEFEKKNISSGQKTFHRPSKTSISRTSNNTSTSCPAAIESSQYTQPQHCALNRFAKRRSLTVGRFQPSLRQPRVFNSMSSEAQHALTETIHESNIPSSQGSVCEEDPYIDDEVGDEGVYSSMPVLKKCATTLDHVYRRKDTFESDANHVECLSDSEFSLYSKRRHRSSISGRTRLPEIYADVVDGQAKCSVLKNFKHSHYRIPGIGRYNVPGSRDTMFEITPVGYDIRYREVIQVEETESETPPPDVKEKAVQKCADWLNRYMQH